MTEGCQALKDKIKELIQVGHLHKIFKTNTSSYRSLQREKYPPRSHKEQYDKRGRDDTRRFDEN